MKRRSFIQQSALGAGALVFSNPYLPLMEKGSENIGVQLYSVRDNMARDPVGTLLRLGEMGYPLVEGAGYKEGKFYGMIPPVFKNLLNTAGLRMPSGHNMVSLKHSPGPGGSLSDAFKVSVEAFSEVGHELYICPSMEGDERDEKSIVALCDLFNKAGEYCKEHGLSFGYHNHDFEFTTAGEKLIMDHLIELTDPDLVNFQLDLYWVAFAGQDPIEWIKKMPGRTRSFHVKDMAATPDKETIEVGEGVIDFASIFEYSDLAGVNYYIVELEHYLRSPMEGVRISLENLKIILG